LFVALAFLGTTNHITFLIAVIEIIILRIFSREKIRIIHLVSLALGATLGLVVVKTFAAGGFSRFGFVVSRSLVSWIDHNLSQLPLTLFSLFNIQWVILISFLVLFFKKDVKYYSLVLLSVVFNYGICFFSLDTTRIFGLLSWGVFIHCIYHSYQIAQNLNSLQEKRQFLFILIAFILLSLLLPRFYSWEGKIYLSPMYESIVRIIS
jgi:hypothetical protein